MITLFSGEFTLVPEAMDASHNWCTHNCGYCFANLNKPDRKINVNALFRQITNYKNQINPVAFMLQHDMVVTVSNKTDPFAKSNDQISIPMLELFDDYKIKYSLQTRGGDLIGKYLDKSPQKKVFYVSITHSTDDTRKLTESGAPSIESRWELIDELIKRGHDVIVAYNPFWHVWLDIDIELKKLDGRKVHGIVMQKLHINNMQYSAMTDRYKKVFIDIFNETKTRKRREESVNNEYYKLFYNKLRCAGFKVKGYSETNMDNVYSIYADVYGVKSCFKTMDDFYIWCKNNKKNNDEVYFKDYYNFFSSDLPFKDKEFYISSYFRGIKTIDKNSSHSEKNKGFIKDVLAVYWNDFSYKRHPTMSSYFSLLTENKKQRVLDYYGNNIYVFNSEKNTNFITEFSNQI